MSLLGVPNFGVEVAKYLEREQHRRTAVSEWQPIETAPKDGRWVLVYGGKSVHDPQDGSRAFECKCDTVIQAFQNLSGEWEGMADGWTYRPTHWMPLPPPPEEK